MAILTDTQIIQRATDQRMIMPFKNYSDNIGKVSSGLSGSGYDATLGTEFKRMLPGNEPIDPKRPEEEYFDVFDTDQPLVMQPGDFVLGVTKETFVIPKDIFVTILEKSTYARCGLHMYVTPVNSGWVGKVVIELANNSPRPVIVYPNEGIAQFIFHETTGEVTNPYDGVYKGQTGIDLPTVK
jgi:dCTP deaminase